MTSTLWKIFDAIGEAAETGNESERIGRMLDAAMETVSDVLPNSDGRVLSEGTTAAAHALTRIRSNSKEPIHEQSADFLAGRLAAIIDILGFAAARTTYATDVESAMEEPHAGIITALGEHKPRKIHDLAAAQDIHPVVMHTILDELTKMGMVTQVLHGQTYCPVLTPAGRLIADELAKGTTSADLLAGTVR
ncbi:hypothetical protein D3C71_420330 [compost metagenome]